MDNVIVVTEQNKDEVEKVIRKSLGKKRSGNWGIMTNTACLVIWNNFAWNRLSPQVQVPSFYGQLGSSKLDDSYFVTFEDEKYLHLQFGEANFYFPAVNGKPVLYRARFLIDSESENNEPIYVLPLDVELTTIPRSWFENQLISIYTQSNPWYVTCPFRNTTQVAMLSSAWNMAYRSLMLRINGIVTELGEVTSEQFDAIQKRVRKNDSDQPMHFDEGEIKVLKSNIGFATFVARPISDDPKDNDTFYLLISCSAGVMSVELDRKKPGTVITTYEELEAQFDRLPISEIMYLIDYLTEIYDRRDISKCVERGDYSYGQSAP